MPSIPGAGSKPYDPVPDRVNALPPTPESESAPNGWMTNEWPWLKEAQAEREALDRRTPIGVALLLMITPDPNAKKEEGK